MGSLDSPEVVPSRASHSVAASAAPLASNVLSGATTATATAPPTPPFLATFSDGRARLSLAGWPLAGVARLENLEVDLPQVAADDAGPLPPERWRNRRGRLVEATVTTDLQRIARELERPGMRARLAAAGISDVRVGLSEGVFRLVGRASMGDREAPFTARAHLARAVPRRPGAGDPAAPPGTAPTSARIRLSIEDLRIYGFLPVPAPIVARAILSSLVQARPGARWWIDFDPLEAALLETFAAHGWRLPDTGGARLNTIAITPQRIALGWSSAPVQPEGLTDGAGDAAGAPAEAARWETPDLDEADGLLARGDHRGALDAYRRALKRRPDGPAVTRVLEILVSSAAHLAEADDLAGEILTRQSDEPLPLLVRAVAAAERGDPALAADTYEQIATIGRRRNEDEDVIIARLAAAEQWLRAEKTDRARRLADQVLATMPAHASGETARLLQILGDGLLARGELAAADQVYESRLALATDGPTRDALAIERARARLLAPDGVPGALAVLGAIPLETASRQALDLRADLGERQVSPDDAVPALDELVARARRAGDEEAARRFEERAAQLLARVDSTLGPSEGPSPPARLDLESEGPTATPVSESPSDGASAEDLERLLVTNPTDAAAAESLAEIYARIGEPRERADALSSLLRRALGLSPDRRKAIYASLGESAEASGDLDRAEQAYWRAATIEAEPALRASFLVSHARVLLARGETETAIGELEEALARVPDHAGALALLGDLAFRQQDWPRARQIYASLAASPGAAEAISREFLIYRRAQVAQAIGQSGDGDGDGEAENHLRELAIINPRHVEARESLADIALGRGDFGAGALRLEEVLRLLPLDALDRLLDVRQRLGGVYLQLQDWTSARYYLELVLAQDPTRTVPLEILIDVYLRLAAYREAAEACGRLARLHAGPRRRAEILYRQGEILRQFLDDEAGALDAFLRASDLDPQFTPALVRLADSYWRHGALGDLAEMAGELAGANFVPDEETWDVPIRLAIATRLTPRTGEAPAPVPSLEHPTGDAARRARVLAEAAAFLGARAPRTLDPVIDALAREGVSDNETSGGPANGFYRALEDLVQEDAACANMGAVRALGRAAERSGWIPAARALYSVLVFVDPSDGAAAALAELGPARTIDPEEIEEGGMLAMLAQRQPLDALETIARTDPLTAHSDRADPARRRELLRSLPARELVSTMLSLDYQRALA